MTRSAVAGATAPASARVRLRMLGEFSLEIGGEERGARMPARARSLLVHLVMHAGTPVTRQRLAFRLWPESTDGQARTNLRNVVHHMRRVAPELEAHVEITPGSLRWAARPDCWVDVSGFIEAANAAAAAVPGSAEHTAALRSAVDLYIGDLLDGTYEDSIEEHRQGLRDRFLAALRELTEALRRGSHASEAVRMAQELVRRDALNEDHHRLLIAAHADAGDRAGGARAYHECVDVLGQELGVPPSEATIDLYRRLVDTDASPADAVTARDTAPPAVSGVVTRLVGRDAELEELTGRWADTISGRPHFVLLTGEPGIGKTHLVEILAAECARQGAVVARARSYLTEGELGYSILIEWLRTPPIADAVARLPSADRAVLSRLLPELGDGTAAPAGVAGDFERLRLFEIAAQALTVGGRPSLLVVDDAHWGDAASLQFIHYMIRSAVGAPVLVAATARREGLDDRHPLTAITDGLHVIDRATTLDLDRLSPGETGALAQALGVGDLDDRAADRLYRETEGNPLFVVEAIHAGWTGAVAHVDLSPKLQAVIGARFRQLSPPAQSVLAVAATVGRAFTADLVGRAADVDEVALVRALDELWRRGVVRSHGADGYDFSHGKLRDVAYNALSPAVRAQHHLRLAECLEGGPPESVDAASGRIAAHFDRAGHVTDAVTWYRRGAVSALRMGAVTDAYPLLERALDLAAGLPEAVRLPLELDLLALVPVSLGSIDGFASDRVATAQQRAVAVSAHLGVEVEPPMLRSMVMASLCRDEFDDARAAAQQLRASAERAGDEGLVIESRYLLGIIDFWTVDLPSAIAHFREVVDCFEPALRDDHLIRFGHDPQAVCLSRMGNALHLLGRTDEARAARDEANSLAEASGDPVTIHTVLVFTAMLALDLDDTDSLRRTALAFTGGLHAGGPFGIKGAALRGYVDILEGRAAAGIELIETSIARCGGQNPAPGFIAALYRMLVGAHMLAGDSTGGLSAAERALALGGTRLWAPEIGRLRARFMASLGKPADAVGAALDEAAAAADRLGQPGVAIRIEATRTRLVGPESEIASG